MNLPKVLAVSGFDPSGGAGILSDIKTFQSHQVYGFGAITSVTIQNESLIKNVRWISEKELFDQLDILVGIHTISTVKIGLTKNIEMLHLLVSHLRDINENMTIVWDPVLTSSSGFVFWEMPTSNLLFETIDKIDLITPNLEEYHKIWNAVEIGKLECKASILLKSAKMDSDTVVDQLFHEGRWHDLPGKKFHGCEKHGTGCVLSSGITAGLAKGLTLIDAYHSARKTLNKFLLGDPSLLGTFN